MDRNLVLSIAAAAALMIAGAPVQAEELHSAGSTIVEASMEGAGGGAYENPSWKEEYPFPRNFNDRGDGD
jgi:hypothetical protein